jgi:hypothetical protein
VNKRERQSIRIEEQVLKAVSAKGDKPAALRKMG